MAAAAVMVILFVAISNLIMINNSKKRIVPDQEMASLDADCILILGAGVSDDNKPSRMLKDRLNEGIRLYNAGIADKILVSGDHGRTNYDEVNIMKDYLIDKGIPSEDIFMDHAGFSTYESIYRAKEIFGIDRLIAVTQRYHMYRALYLCEQLGIEAYGSPSDPWRYSGVISRNLRELLARDKDIFSCLFKIKPKYLGDKIDIHGSGDVTDD